MVTMTTMTMMTMMTSGVTIPTSSPELNLIIVARLDSTVEQHTRLIRVVPLTPMFFSSEHIHSTSFPEPLQQMRWLCASLHL